MSRKTHGMYKSPEHKCWRGMKYRCTNPNSPDYDDYMGRGITVCDSWLESFSNFFNDVGKRPGPGYSLHRIDNDKGYCKENCKWADKYEQDRNRRVTRNPRGRYAPVEPEPWEETGVVF